MIYNLFRLAVVFIPFTAITGLSFLGESQHEVSAYIFIAALALSLFPVMAYFRMSSTSFQPKIAVYALPKIMAVFFAVVLISFIANFVEIKDSYFHGRNGLTKFISSNVLVLYGFCLAYLTYFISAGKRLDDLLIKPMVLSIGLCAFFSFFEVSARWVDVFDGMYNFLTSFIYGNVPALDYDLRLRSVAFEPPDFANTVGYIWPWILTSILFARGAWKGILIAVFVVLNAMLVMSDSRTSMVIIMGLAAIFILLRTVFFPPNRLGDPDKMVLPVTIVCVLIVPVFLIFFTYYYEDMVFAVISGDRVSNISRLASITAAFQMFESRPIFGFGFGQYAFHMADFMPFWGYYSWEIRTWLLESMNYWPSVYSIYGRFAADMGMFGILMWTGIWLWLARTLLVTTLAYRKIADDLPFAAYPLIMGCFGVLLSGVANDSVRSPMIWIIMGLACRYLYEIKKATVLLEHKKDEQQ